MFSLNSYMEHIGRVQIIIIIIVHSIGQQIVHMNICVSVPHHDLVGSWGEPPARGPPQSNCPVSNNNKYKKLLDFDMHHHIPTTAFDWPPASDTSKTNLHWNGSFNSYRSANTIQNICAISCSHFTKPTGMEIMNCRRQSYDNNAECWSEARWESDPCYKAEYIVAGI